MLSAIIPCGMMASAVPALAVGIVSLLPALARSHGEQPRTTAATVQTARRGYEVEFTLPPGQVAVFEVVTRTNRALIPLPGLGMYWINSSEEACAGKFVWADDPPNLGLDGKPRWRFGIITTNGNTLAEGLGVPLPPPGFSSSLDAWVALRADEVKVLGLPPGGEARPGYGLRILTQKVETQPGLKHRATGFGTNWMEMLPEKTSAR
jgi:hypothetical protein